MRSGGCAKRVYREPEPTPAWSNQMPEETLQTRRTYRNGMMNSACSWIFDSAENRAPLRNQPEAGRRLLALYATTIIPAAFMFGPSIRACTRRAFYAVSPKPP
jgi:hypothetical protein